MSRLARLLLVPLLIALALIAAAFGPLGRFLNAPAYDLFSTLAPPAPADDVVIVAIDEPSFAEVGRQWPWPRSLHADLVKALRAAGARAIAFDVVFAEPSTDPQADAALAAALGPDVVLAADETVIESPHARQAIRVEPLDALVANGAASGVVAVALDRDGVLRRLPPFADGFAATLAGSAPIPNALARFRGGPRTYRTVSYYQALDPAAFLPPGMFAGKTVFVGLSTQTAADASSSGADAFATPFTSRDGRLLAGVEAQATFFDSLRAGDLVAPAAGLTNALAILAAAFAGAVLGARSVSWRVVAVSAAGCLAIGAGSFAAFHYGGLWTPPIAPALALLLAIGAEAGLDYARERRKRQEVTRAFSQYLAPEIVARLARDPSSLKLGGERKTLTILFCDIRGFTELAERLKTDPERLTSLINRLLGPLTEATLAEGGTIDKYIGDCLMAFWNAPLDAPDHADRAIAAGLRMLEAVTRLNAELAAEAGTAVTPVELAVGVGINTGDCVVGNLGSERRFDYTAIGDAVNLASRLESASRFYETPILIGEDTAQIVARPLVEIDRIAVKGRRDGIAVFTALPGGGQPPTQGVFLEAYRCGRWDEAEAALSRLAFEEPRLALYAAQMTERVQALRRDPPPADWAGVFTAAQK